MSIQVPPVPAPDAEVAAAARAHIDALAKPLGSLGVLEDLAVWWAGARGALDAPPPQRPALAIFAADHGVATRGVSAYPAAITVAMVRAYLSGGAGADVLAAQHGVSLRVADVGVDTDWEGVDIPAGLTEGKARRGSEPIDEADALTPDEFARAVGTGRRLADEFVDAGHDLLLTGEMGIGNTTPTAAVVAALTGADPDTVVGRGSGVDDDALARKRAVVRAALARVAASGSVEGWEAARRLGGADLAAMAGFCVQAAVRRTPVLLDGVMSGAAALVARAVDPGTTAWFAAGHRSVEPAHRLTLDLLGLHPIIDLGLRLGEGTGAMTALPVLRSAVGLARDMAPLADVARFIEA